MPGVVGVPSPPAARAPRRLRGRRPDLLPKLADTLAKRSYCLSRGLGPPQVMAPPQLPRPAIVFGLAGLMPQAICLLLVARGGPEGWFALAAACFYAAIILSFLGGLWWMTALLTGVRSAWMYALAVSPSLIGFAALLPWCAGWRWPHPSLVALGLTLLASPLVDFYLNRRASLPTGWLRLRAVMASGLGILTLLVAAA